MKYKEIDYKYKWDGKEDIDEFYSKQRKEEKIRWDKYLNDLIENSEDDFVREIGEFLKSTFFFHKGNKSMVGPSTFLEIIDLHRKVIKDIN